MDDLCLELLSLTIDDRTSAACLECRLVCNLSFFDL